MGSPKSASVVAVPFCHDHCSLAFRGSAVAPILSVPASGAIAVLHPDAGVGGHVVPNPMWRTMSQLDPSGNVTLVPVATDLPSGWSRSAEIVMAVLDSTTPPVPYDGSSAPFAF